jgi:hypothetical protein
MVNLRPGATDGIHRFERRDVGLRAGVAVIDSTGEPSMEYNSTNAHANMVKEVTASHHPLVGWSVRAPAYLPVSCWAHGHARSTSHTIVSYLC